MISASGESNITSQTFPVPARVPAAQNEGGVMVRVAHAVQGITDDNDNPQPVDIVAAAPDASPSEGTELAAGASMGDVTPFAEVPSGTYDVYIFPEGADRTEANALTTLTGVGVSGDSPQTFYVYGSASGTISAQAVGYLEPPSAPDFSCQALTQDPGPTGGFCFDECSPGDYGQGSCPGTGNACQPLIDSHFCTPTQGTEQGSSCTPSDSAFVTACEEGAYCEEFGDGSGQCRSRCIKGDSSNDTLTCGDSTTCNAPSEGDFGQCQISCTPGSEASDSESCPENLQSCFPTTTSEGSAQRAFCSASGSKAEGEECGGSGPGLLQQNCEAGLICAYSESTGTSFTGMTSRQEDAENPPTCRQRCQPFASDSGCPDGQSCWPDFAVTGGSDATGVCMKNQEVQSKSTGIPCDNPGQLCGDASLCVTLQGDNFCYELCDPDASENTCSEPQDTTRNCRRVTNGAVGQCLPPQN